MKVVVFGGSGFLGSYVADVLTERGYEVAIFDLRPSLHAQPCQQMIVGDVTDSAAVQEVLENCESLYHFAGMADLDDANTRPLDTVKHNIMGTVALLDAAVRAGVKRFVFASTIYVYSQLGGFYRCSKQAGELYVEEYQKRYGLDYTILRYGTLYGPRSDERNSVHRYLKQGLLEGKIEFNGSKDDIREYIHARDAARLSVDILSESFRNQHVVITGHHPMKATELLNMIREILNQQLSIEFNSPSQNAHYAITPYSFLPKVANKLVSNPYVDMGQGLLECLHEIYSSVNKTDSPSGCSGREGKER